jgi:hypothetical protein
MFTEQTLERHYASIPSDALQIIRDEYQWALDECGVHTEEQLRFIEKALSRRGEKHAPVKNRKILFLCKCGQSRIVSTTTEDNKINGFILDQYTVPCPMCQSRNKYSWKYI